MRRIDRRTAIVRLAMLPLGSLLATHAWAQSSLAPMLRIGILSSGEAENRMGLEQALLEGLRDQGYSEGRNLVVERRYSSAQLRDNAAALAAMRLDAVLTTCTPSTRIMKDASSSVPIVMVGVSDPVRQGVIASLARPGNNVTGMSSQAEDLLAKRLEMVAAVLPARPLVGVVLNTGNPVHLLGWERMQPVAQDLSLPLRKVELARPSDLEPATDAAVRAGVGALFVMPDDPMMFNLRPRLAEVAAAHRLPDFHWERRFAESGGLLSYGEDLRTSYRAGAAYMAKIKRGANPGELPVEQPTRFELVINLRTAKARGVTVPDALMLRADDVIR